MPAPLLAGAFSLAIIVPLVVSLMTALGIGIVTYTGMSFALDSAETYIASQFAGLPSDMYSVMQMAGFDQGIAILFAGYGAAITIRTTMGAFTKIKFTPVS